MGVRNRLGLIDDWLHTGHYMGKITVTSCIISLGLIFTIVRMLAMTIIQEMDLMQVLGIDVMRFSR